MTEQDFTQKIAYLLMEIKAQAARIRVDPNMICALIWQESGGDPFAVRFEEKTKLSFKASEYAKQQKITLITETTLQNCSWGIMQIMGFTARELGYDGPLIKLCEPLIGLYFGCNVILSKMKRYKMMDDVIAAYNAGSALRRDGKYINESYVESVKFRWAKIEKLGLFK